MEKILARFPTMDSFLADTAATIEYREALKEYMGEKSSFDDVYHTFLRQIREVASRIPEFSNAAWEQNLQWQQQSYFLEGSISGSGLEIKGQNMSKLIKELTAEAERAANPIIKLSVEEQKTHIELVTSNIQAAVSEVQRFRQEHNVLTAESYAGLTSRQKKEYNAEMGRRGVFKQLSMKEAEIKKQSTDLSAYLVHYLLTQNEGIGDHLLSDADIAKTELEKLKTPGSYIDFLQEKGITLPIEILRYLEISFPAQEKFAQAYKAGEEEIKRFRNIPDPRLDADIVERLGELQAQGVAPREQRERLNDDQKTRFDKWARETRTTQEKKKKAAAIFEEQSPFFYYVLIEDAERATFRLKTQGGTKLHFRPSPRPFHSFFAGRKKGECVGGISCASLTPRRWARPALKGSRTLFTEFDGGRMEGYMGLTPIINQANGEQWDVVDIMSHAIKGDVVVNQDGQSTKFSFFDLWVERENPAGHSKGLVISNGNSVSQNVAGGEVVLQSPAYREQKLVGEPKSFSPSDPIGNKIAEHFPDGMYRGGMIYDGMKTDGSGVYELVKTKDRRRWTLEELERRVFLDIMLGEEITDRHVVWKIARESRLKLKNISFYHDLSRNFSQLSPETQQQALSILENALKKGSSEKTARIRNAAKTLCRLSSDGSTLAKELMIRILQSPDDYKFLLPDMLRGEITKAASASPDKYYSIFEDVFLFQSYNKYLSSADWAAEHLQRSAVAGNQSAKNLITLPMREPARAWAHPQREASAYHVAQMVISGDAELRSTLFAPHKDLNSYSRGSDNVTSTYKGLAYLAKHGDKEARDVILNTPLLHLKSTEVATALKELVLWGDSAALKILEANQTYEHWRGHRLGYSTIKIWSVKGALREIKSEFLNKFSKASLKQKKAILKLIKDNPDSEFLKSILAKAQEKLPAEIREIVSSREARRALMTSKTRFSAQSCMLLLQLFNLKSKP